MDELGRIEEYLDWMAYYREVYSRLLILEEKCDFTLVEYIHEADALFWNSRNKPMVFTVI